uniref:ZP domain-containing protein n=1 Tax=Panagrellus redivivus TaxID=6233 RepID=A0A7E4VWB7_PANRE
MSIAKVYVLVFCIKLMLHIQGTQVARAVEGGVELLSLGEVELILPDELSFTVKSPGPFRGKAEFFCLFGYHNFVETCPEGTCVLLISEEHRAHGFVTERRGSIVHYQYKDIGDIKKIASLITTCCHFSNPTVQRYIVITVLRTQRRGSVVHYQFGDFNDDMWCPRLVINGRQNFIILELPQAPVIVNGASLPKNETASAKISTKWVVIICVVIFLMILVVVIFGVCIYMQIKKKHTSVKHVQSSKKSMKSHCKTSAAVVSPVSSKRNQSKRDAQLNSSNSANNNEDV